MKTSSLVFLFFAPIVGLAVLLGGVSGLQWLIAHAEVVSTWVSAQMLPISILVYVWIFTAVARMLHVPGPAIQAALAAGAGGLVVVVAGPWLLPDLWTGTLVTAICLGWTPLVMFASAWLVLPRLAR